MSAAFQQSNHFTIVPDDDSSDLSRAKREHPSNPPVVRWVKIGDKTFPVTPQTRYDHVLSNGQPYYPYYDHDLIDGSPDDYYASPDDYYFEYYDEFDNPL
jgi:hypothetical protein